jgi:glucoamylase
MRSVILSNGHILVNLDDKAQIRDFYFPYVGLENHVLGRVHRVGVWVDGNFSWLSSDSWRSTCHFQKSTMVGESIFVSDTFGLTISFIDAVDTSKNIFVRKIVVKNNVEKVREVRIFFCHEYLIGEHRLANTAFFDPLTKSLIHYKGRRVFLMNGMGHNFDVGFSDYTVGVWGYNGAEGSFHDAEDGVLGKNSVDHGPADSVGSLSALIEPLKEIEMHYWIAAGKSIGEVHELNERVTTITPQQIIEVSSNFWKAWVNKKKQKFEGLSDSLVSLYNRSLLVVRAHFDNSGGVIASCDSDRLSYGKEGYTFVWPRDGAFAAMALDNAGYSEVTEPFFEFMESVITKEGYIHHKYLPDRSLGSTWHSSVKQKQWLSEEKLQLPIQEDETSSIVFALWNHYNCTKNIEMVERMYETLIYPAGKFMMKYRDDATGLPKESYDLWEEKLGVATYTTASVYGGLMACGKFAQLLGKKKHLSLYHDVAAEIKQAIITHLFSKTRNAFIRTVYFKEDGKLQYEEIVDCSSLYSLWFYGVLTFSDPLFKATEEVIANNLKDTCPTGGFIRYENDEYYRHSDKSNPWFICTLWDLQLKIKKAKTKAELKETINGLNWVLKHTTESGILAEQLDAYSGKPLCVSPLTWSHSTFIDTVVMYLQKLEKLG